MVPEIPSMPCAPPDLWVPCLADAALLPNILSTASVMAKWYLQWSFVSLSTSEMLISVAFHNRSTCNPNLIFCSRTAWYLHYLLKVGFERGQKFRRSWPIERSRTQKHKIRNNNTSLWWQHFETVPTSKTYYLHLTVLYKLAQLAIAQLIFSENIWVHALYAWRWRGCSLAQINGSFSDALT